MNPEHRSVAGEETANREREITKECELVREQLLREIRGQTFTLSNPWEKEKKQVLVPTDGPLFDELQYFWVPEIHSGQLQHRRVVQPPKAIFGSPEGRALIDQIMQKNSLDPSHREEIKQRFVSQ